MVARSVCCRSSAVRLPPVSSRNRWSQPAVQLGQRHRPQPGRGQLDRQRHPVQPPAHRHHQRGGLLIHGQGDAAGPGPVHQQRHRIRGPGRRRTGVAGAGQRQGRHPIDGLAADAQRLAAGGQQVHPRAAPHDRLRGLGAAADQVLAVVHHDQHILQRQGVQQRLQRQLARLPGKPQRPGDGRRHRVAVGDRGQLRQPHPVPGPVQQLGRHLQPQPGLPAPAGPGQRDQARRRHQRPDLARLPVPADERRQFGGQIVRQRRVAQRPQRREPRGQARRG